MFDSFWFVPWCMFCYCVGAFIGVRFLRQIDLRSDPGPGLRNTARTSDIELQHPVVPLWQPPTARTAAL